MPKSPSIPFPLVIEDLSDGELLWELSSMEIGAGLRLLRTGWRQDDPCTLPDEDAFLATVARITDEEWSRVRPRIFLALSATGGYPGGRVLLSRARRVYDTLSLAWDQKRSAGRASAAARARSSVGAPEPNGRSTTVERPLNARSTTVAAPSLRSSLPLALPLNRPTEQLNPGALQGAQDVIALLGDGARAILDQKVEQWQLEKSLGMLQEAFSRWSKAGLTGVPLSKASELARCTHATPARVNYLIEDADGKIAHGKNTGRSVNPVGIVIHGLGESEASQGTPVPVPIFVTERWSRLQASTLQVMQAQAAISAKVNAAKTALGPSAPIQGRGARA